VITKNTLIARDIDVLAPMARHGIVRVILSMITLDPALTRVMEPRTATPAKRLLAMRQLAEAGIPVGINVAPVIPGLTDEEIPAILTAAWEHGASFASWSPVRLPGRWSRCLSGGSRRRSGPLGEGAQPHPLHPRGHS